MHNATTLDNEESFAKPFFLGPAVPMLQQNALVFAPIRDVFGGQTGNDAANDRFGFRSALNQNVDSPEALGTTEQYYRLAEDGVPSVWRKDWSTVIPPNAAGEYVVGDVAQWLWQRFIADGGANFDAIAQAQVHALAGHGFDFAAVVDRNDLDALYSSEDLEDGFAAEVNRELAATVMNFTDPSRTGPDRHGGQFHHDVALRLCAYRRIKMNSLNDAISRRTFLSPDHFSFTGSRCGGRAKPGLLLAQDQACIPQDMPQDPGQCHVAGRSRFPLPVDAVSRLTPTPITFPCSGRHGGLCTTIPMQVTRRCSTTNTC